MLFWKKKSKVYYYCNMSWDTVLIMIIYIICNLNNHTEAWTFFVTMAQNTNHLSIDPVYTIIIGIFSRQQDWLAMAELEEYDNRQVRISGKIAWLVCQQIYQTSPNIKWITQDISDFTPLHYMQAGGGVLKKSGTDVRVEISTSVPSTDSNTTDEPILRGYNCMPSAHRPSVLLPWI